MYNPRRLLYSQGLVYAEQSSFAALKVISLIWRNGAGEGNRTLVSSLGSCSSTIELHPLVCISASLQVIPVYYGLLYISFTLVLQLLYS